MWLEAVNVDIFTAGLYLLGNEEGNPSQPIPKDGLKALEWV